MEKAKEVYMYVLGAVVVVGGFVLAYLIIFNPVPEANRSILDVAFGLVLGWGGAVVGYFYGSSKSSADKTQLLSKTGGGQ